MKKLFTKFLVICVLSIFSFFSVNGQTYLNVSSETTVELTKVNIQSLDYLSVSTDNWATAKTYCSISGDFYNMSSVGRILNIDVSNVSSFDLYVQNSNVGRTFSVTVGSGSPTIITHSGGNCESFSISTGGNTGNLRIKLEGTGSSVYPSKIILYPPAFPSISSFSVAGVDATIDESAKTITAELPYGTNLTSLTPTVTIGGTATSYSPTGVQDFSNSVTTPVTYTATDGSNNVDYAVTLTVSTAASTDATLSDLKVDGTTVTGFDASTMSYNVALPYAYSGLPIISATVNDVTAIKNITQITSIPGSAVVDVTAQDGITTKQYTVNFTRIPVSTACDITAFSINGKSGIINTSDNSIVVSLFSNANLTALTPAVTVSPLASYSPTGAQDFTNPVDYIVTAEDETTQKIYHVSVSPIDPYSGPYPYETTFPSDYTIPAWMSSPTNGITFNNAYNGSDYTLWTEPGETTTASVIRLNSYTDMEFYLSKCRTFTADLSATGSRVYTLSVNGSIVTTTSTVSSGLIYSLSYDVNLNEPVVVKIGNQNNGGVTLGHLKIEGNFLGTGLNNTSENDIYFDGKIIHNNSSAAIQVYDITGRRIINSANDIDMTSSPKGVYVVKSLNDTIKIALVR